MEYSLRKDRKALKQLRQKMAVLWGNLYEVKTSSQKRPYSETPKLQEQPLAPVGGNDVNVAAAARKRRRREKDKAKKRRKQNESGGEREEDGEEEEAEEEGEEKEAGKNEMEVKGNEWFECCVGEYGVYEENGYVRKWKMFGTTIH